jgi:hypothetical protein
MSEKAEILGEVIARIEAGVPGSIVVWTGPGSYDSEEDDEPVETIEVYMVPKELYGRFLELVVELDTTVGQPNGVSIMVHALSPEATRKHRQRELEAELRRRTHHEPSRASGLKKKVESPNPES